MDQRSGKAIPLKNLAEDWYGQCWSLNEETDAMWRIYSPDPKKPSGIKVKTTIGKLFNNLKRTCSPAPYLQFFVGRVIYESQTRIADRMKNLTFRKLSESRQSNWFADLLCLKREAFQHENEVRLLFS